MAKLTQEQADAIRAKFYVTPGWHDIARGFPRWADAIAALPDETLIDTCTPMFRDMYADAREFVVSGTGPLSRQGATP